MKIILNIDTINNIPSLEKFDKKGRLTILLFLTLHFIKKQKVIDPLNLDDITDLKLPLSQEDEEKKYPSFTYL